MRGQSNLGLTSSISWLLMPWLLTSPGHQHPWYWPCRIGRSLPYFRKYFNYMCHVNEEEWHKMLLFPLNNLACKGLNSLFPAYLPPVGTVLVENIYHIGFWKLQGLSSITRWWRTLVCIIGFTFSWNEKKIMLVFSYIYSGTVLYALFSVKNWNN